MSTQPEGIATTEAQRGTEPVPMIDNTGYEIFVAALSILSIINLVLIFMVEDQALEYVLQSMNLLLSLVLFFDFLYRMRKAPVKGHYFWREFGWADLGASLPLPQLKVLRVFRLIKVWRLAKVYGTKRLLTALVKERAETALFLLLLIAVLVLEFGSLAMLRIEQPVEGANITSASDALWYVLVTISTVGYGDQFPVTNLGRVLGVGIIVLGVGIFGTLTGFLANAFIAPRKSADDVAAEESAAAAEEDRRAELHDKVDDLHRMLAEQQQTIARLETLLTQR
ncbi:potassium channel family protein [Longivirga aurantiaca]|uniref:Potassium channel family protein n=1 Tax=Longivirga aurantiaca TaxID=1837743 RepID=A0ABW1SYX7_9ACTN